MADDLIQVPGEGNVVFTFEPGTPEDVQKRRIENWKKRQAGTPSTVSPRDKKAPLADRTAVQPAMTVSDVPAFELPDETGYAGLAQPSAGGEKKKGPPDGLYKAITGLLTRGALAALPGANIVSAAVPGLQEGILERTTDKGWGRTALQGVTPWSDEALAFLASKAKGTSYEDEMAKEAGLRKGFEDKYGTGEAMLTELGGGVAATVPMLLTGGAGLSNLATKAPILQRVMQFAASNPKTALAATGFVTGAAQGAGVGRGEERLRNSMEMGALGAAAGPAIHKAGDIVKWFSSFSPDSSLGKYFRSRAQTELGDKIEQFARQRNIPLARNADGTIDTASPGWSHLAERVMRDDLASQRAVGARPMLSDTLPGTTEAVLQKPGQETTGLAKDLARRQFDWELNRTNPTLAADLGQRGRVEDLFDLALGPNSFKGTEEALINARKANAKAGFAPAHAIDVRSPELEQILNNPYIQQAWKSAADMTTAGGKRIGPVNPITGSMSSYNTEFLHNIKKALDDRVTKETDSITRAVTNEGRTAANVRRDLANEMARLNPDYAAAVKKFGEDSELVDALRSGREKMWSNPDKGGWSVDDMNTYLADPNVSDAAKDLFREGAARALRAKLLEPTNKKFTHNWADFINAPGVRDKIAAIIENPQSRELLMTGLDTEARNFAQVARAMGNSRTSPRQELVRELDNASPADALTALLGGDMSAIGLTKRAMNFLKGTSDKVSGVDRNANRVASLLRTTGKRDTDRATREIRNLLDRSARFNSNWDDTNMLAGLTLPMVWPSQGNDRP